MRIDLHTHSNRSDGSDTPEELVKQAAAAGLDVVALTDHDTVAGWSEAVEASERLSIKVVPGVELSTSNAGRSQHLLGYNVCPTHPAIEKILTQASTSREDRVLALFAKLDELGLSVDREYVTSLAGGIVSRKHVAAGLVKEDTLTVTMRHLRVISTKTAPHISSATSRASKRRLKLFAARAGCLSSPTLATANGAWRL